MVLLCYSFAISFCLEVRYAGLDTVCVGLENCACAGVYAFVVLFVIGSSVLFLFGFCCVWVEDCSGSVLSPCCL